MFEWDGGMGWEGCGNKEVVYEAERNETSHRQHSRQYLSYHFDHAVALLLGPLLDDRRCMNISTH